MPRPKTGETPVRHIRIAAALWGQVVAAAKEDGCTYTDVVIEALTRYFEYRRRASRKAARD